MPMPAALWPNTLLHRHYVFSETDQEAVNKAKLYVDGHGVELWEGTRQVALRTRSNLPFEQRRLFAAASAPPSGRLLGNDRRSLGSNAWAFDEPRRDPQHAPYTSGPSTDFSSDDSIPLSDLQGQPDPREFAPLAASQRTSILTRV